MTGFGIYLHWPYCRSKCPYCDFVSIVSKAIDYEKLEQCYIQQLKECKKTLPDVVVSSVFFGGGTPSLLPVNMVASLIHTIKQLWETTSDIEISLEANPCSIDKEKMIGLKTAGVNRLSIGVQSLNDKDLKFLGRLHNSELALKTIQNAKDIFPLVSADFIYGLPNQTLNDWQQELDAILALNLKHLSLYQLTIEEGTFFYKKGIQPPEDELSADMFELTDRMTYMAGIERYEVSNHAVKGYECKHNLLYWQGGQWFGIGPAAHGRFTCDNQFIATSETPDIKNWLLGKNADRTILTTKEKAEELILMALRTNTGLNRQTFLEIIHKPVEDFIHTGTLEDYQLDGLMISDKKGIRVTGKGLLLLDSLCRSLLI